MHAPSVLPIIGMAAVHFTPSKAELHRAHMRRSFARKSFIPKNRVYVLPQNLQSLAAGKGTRFDTAGSLNDCVAPHVINTPNTPSPKVQGCSREIPRAGPTCFQAGFMNFLAGMYYTTVCVATASAYEGAGCQMIRRRHYRMHSALLSPFSLRGTSFVW